MESASPTASCSSDFYDRIATDYDAQIDTPENRAIRECFWSCAEAALSPHSRILDFGAGSGIDAQHFAQLGHFIAAYDCSEGMLAVLRERCAGEIASRSIVTVGGTLEQAAPALTGLAPFDAILSNFAVFSAISKPRAVFELFASLVRPGAPVLIAVQNPWQPAQLRTRSFWRALVAPPFTGTLRYRSAESGDVFHHTRRQLVRAASNAFLPARSAVAPCRRCFGLRSTFRLVELTRR
jgi:SAM-dependent methyltransferase